MGDKGDDRGGNGYRDKQTLIEDLGSNETTSIMTDLVMVITITDQNN